MKKIYSVFLIGYSLMAHSATQATPEQERIMQASHRAYFKSQGLQFPEQGVHVVSPGSINLPDGLRKEVAMNQRSFLKQGYVENKNQRIIEIRDINHILTYDKQKQVNDGNPENTDLKKAVSEIKMAYSFREVPSEYVSNLIGFAAAGAYINEGWTGILEIFTKKDFGNCFYEENNLKLAQSSIRIPSNIVTKSVNEKTTTSHVEGNDKDGFLYTVEWYDETLSHKLECVNQNYSTSNLSSIIEMAKGIDR